MQNKTMATLMVIILATSMALSIGMLAQPAGAEVINGVNYDPAIAAASAIETYFIPAVAGLFIAIVVVGLAVILALKKRA